MYEAYWLLTHYYQGMGRPEARVRRSKLRACICYRCALFANDVRNEVIV
jgi:hypothetical protein